MPEQLPFRMSFSAAILPLAATVVASALARAEVAVLAAMAAMAILVLVKAGAAGEDSPDAAVRWVRRVAVVAGD